MNATDFTTTLITDQSPSEVFNAITNVRGWWSEEIEGNTSKLNDEFKYHYEDIHRCKIKLTEVIPNRKIVWLVEENCFTHFGLVPDYECFDICRDSWTNYIQNSLRKLITTGKGEPNAAGKPQTENEKKLSAKK